MFYDVYEKLCKENGEKPFSLPLKLGAKSNSVVAQWKKGSLPRADMLQKIADYFGVSVDFLLSDETATNQRAASEAELTPKQKEAWDLLCKMDDDVLEKFINAAKAMLGI